MIVNAVFAALSKALADVWQPRILALALVPPLAAIAVWIGLAWMFSDDWARAVTDWIANTSWLGWVRDWGLSSIFIWASGIAAVALMLPVVLVTAVHDISVALAAIRNGAYDYLLKPFEREQLLAVVRRALETYRLRMENRLYQSSLETKVRERTEELSNALDELERSYNSILEALGDALDGDFSATWDYRETVQGLMSRLVDRVDPPTANVARERYGCLTPWEGDAATYGRAATTGRYRVCEKEAVAMLRDMVARQVEYSERDGERYFDAAQNARLIADAERYGANSLLLMMNLGAMPGDVFLKQLRRFAKEVLPKLQAHQVKQVPAAA